MVEYGGFGDFDAVTRLPGPRMRVDSEQRFADVVYKGLVGCLAVEALRHVEHGEFSDNVLVANEAGLGEDKVRWLQDALAWLASGYGHGLNLKGAVQGIALDLTSSITSGKGTIDDLTGVPAGMARYINRVNSRVAAEREAGRLEGCYVEAYSERLWDGASRRWVSLCIIDAAVPYSTGLEPDKPVRTGSKVLELAGRFATGKGWQDRDLTNAIVSRAVYMVPDSRSQPIVGTLALRAIVPQQPEGAVLDGIAKLRDQRHHAISTSRDMSRVGTVFNMATSYTFDTYAAMGAFGSPVWAGTGGAGEVALNEVVAGELTLNDD